MYSDEYNNEEMNQNYEETTRNNSNNSSLNKKMLWIVIAAIILVLIVILYLWLGSGDKPNAPGTIIPQITISSQKENLSLGNSLPLKAIVTNIENATIVWTSSNEAVATVDNMGNVTGVSEGTAIITATYLHTDNQPYSISCEVTILKGDPNILLTNVKFPEGEVLIGEGIEDQIPVIIEPADAYVANIKYISTDPTIVTVDEKNGKIKAIKEGQAEIRLNANDGDFTDQITVNVTKTQVDFQIFVPVSSIQFDKPLLKLVVGSDPIQLSYKILPENALSDDLEWESSDPTVASINKGIVSPLKVGTAIITVKSLNGENATMEVEVVEENVSVTGIEILNNSKDDPNYTEKTKTFNLKVNDTVQILANVLPSNATNKEISYKSDKESVATVDEDGFVTAISKGTAIITLISKENNNATEKITINVTANSSYNPGTTSIKVKEIKPASSYVSVANGSTISVTPTITPSNASNKNIDCNSSDESIASVSRDGGTCKITGKKVGNTEVTLKAKDGSNVSAKITVNVVSAGTISNVNSSYSVSVGGYISINPTLSGTLKVTNCTANNPTIASASVVTGSGGASYCSVKGLKQGETQLTIAATGGGQTVTETTTINITNVTDDDWHSYTTDTLYPSGYCNTLANDPEYEYKDCEVVTGSEKWGYQEIETHCETSDGVTIPNSAWKISKDYIFDIKNAALNDCQNRLDSVLDCGSHTKITSKSCEEAVNSAAKYTMMRRRKSQ